MCASLKDVLKAGGTATLESVRQVMKEHEQLKKQVRQLQRKESELTDRLQAEILHRQGIAQKARSRGDEIRRLRAALGEDIESGRTAGASKTGEDTGDAHLARRLEKMQSEFDELRKSAEKATAEARLDEQNRLLKGLGQLLDSLTRAIEMSDGAWREGLQAIEAQFVKFLKEEGVNMIGAVGDEMDPWLHNAVDQVDHPAFGTGFVVEVRRTGFQLDDGTLVRPAFVVVAK